MTRKFHEAYGAIRGQQIVKTAKRLAAADVPRRLAVVDDATRARWDRSIDVDYERRLLVLEEEIEAQLRGVFATWSDEWWARVKQLDKTRSEVLRVRARLKG